MTRAYVVSGPAGAGKTTLGQELARELHATIVDLDTVTNPLLDAVFEHSGLPGHWNDAVHRSWLRPARYAVLRAVATEQVRLGNGVVLVAPFTAERSGGAEWDRLIAALEPAQVVLVWIDVPPDVLAERVRVRGDARDGARSDPDVAPPLVPHLWVDGTRRTADQLAEVLGALTRQPR
jgi:sugar-phosphatase